MKKLNDNALALATLFVMGPGFSITYKRGVDSIPPVARRAFADLVDARVISIEEGQDESVTFRGLARARTVGRIMPLTRAEKINLQISPLEPYQQEAAE